MAASGACVQQQAPTVVIPNCNNIVNNICQGCVSGYFLRSGACVKVSVLCSSYNLTTGICTGCINGYTFINAVCYDINCLNQN